MRCLDSTFLIDAAKGRPGATRKAEQMAKDRERVAAPAPVLAEVMVGAILRGGAYHRRMVDMLANIEIIATSADIAMDAGELGAEMARRGKAAGTIDLLVAATARRSGSILVTRDEGLAGIPGLAVEAY